MSDALEIGYIHISASIIIPVGWSVDTAGNFYPPGAVLPANLSPTQKVPPDQKTAIQPPYVFYPPAMGVAGLTTPATSIAELKQVLSVMQLVNGLTPTR